MKKYLLAISGLFVLWVMAAHAQPSASANTHIIHVLKSQFERPNKPLDVPVVVVSGDYAVADWLQGDKGGRALLRRNADGWRVQMCSGHSSNRLRCFVKLACKRMTQTKLAVH